MSATLMAYAINASDVLFGSIKTFSMIRTMYVTVSSLYSFICSNKLSWHHFTAGSLFHLLISAGEAFMLIDGRFALPKTEKIASLVLDVKEPLLLLCFTTNYLKKLIYLLGF